MTESHTEKLKPGTIDPKVVAKGKEVVEKKARALAVFVTKYVSVDAIKANPWNPNRQSPHEFELLCQSMREDGFTQAIVAVLITAEFLADPAFQGKGYQVGDTVICDGEHRWRAAKHLGFSEIPVAYAPMTPAQMRIATLRHNRARGSEDIELTAELMRDLRQLGALDWAQSSLMMDDTELTKLLEDVAAPEALAGEEFSQAWEPDKTGSGTGTVKPGHETDGTPEALAKAREQELAIAAAKTEEEKRAALKDHDVFRLALMFTGDEAKVVKKVLGERPAVKVLEWCKATAAMTQA